ncbi:5'-3' exonuclease [Aeromonas phage vB_AsaP_MQM1]|nr:5'-3' exonuclease [Aeromonas phage vB_AsaP_MQM1]
MSHVFLTDTQLNELRDSGVVVSLLDCDIPCYSIGFQCEEESSWSMVEKTVDNFMRKVIRESNGTHFIGFLTNGGKNFRLDDAVTVPYKGNRAGKDKPKWFNQIREYLVKTWKCQVMHGIEADDALCIAQQYFMDRGIHSVICSLDKDLRQQPGWHLNWNTGILDYVDEDKGQFYLWRQVLTGDMGTDNIPGLSESAWKPEGPVKVPVFEDFMKVPTEAKLLKGGKPSTRTMLHCKQVGHGVIEDHKAPSDMLCGKVRAESVLEGVAVEDYPTVVLQEYVDAYWVDGEVEELDDPAEKGMHRFYEVFRLIYMLRFVDEIPNEAVISFEPQVAVTQTFNEFDEDDTDVLSDFDDEF